MDLSNKECHVQQQSSRAVVPEESFPVAERYWGDVGFAEICLLRHPWPYTMPITVYLAVSTMDRILRPIVMASFATFIVKTEAKIHDNRKKQDSSTVI